MEAYNIPKIKNRKKKRQVYGNVKVLLTLFLDSSGVVHHEYAPHSTTVTKEYYQEVLRRLRDAVKRKRVGSFITITQQVIVHNWFRVS